MEAMTHGKMRLVRFALFDLNVDSGHSVAHGRVSCLARTAPAQPDQYLNPVNASNKSGPDPDADRCADFIPGRNSTDRPERM